MHKAFHSLIGLFFILMLSCCQTPSANQGTPNSNPEIQFAKNFTIENKKGYSVLTVKNPWKGSNQIFKYVVHPRGAPVPTGLKNAVFIPTPIKSVACLSTTHVGLLNFLDAGDLITAMSGTAYVYDEKIRQRIQSNEITELGNSENLNFEKLIEAAPDVVFTYSLGTDNNMAKMKELGIKPVILAEYMDHSPLARAEWVKFLAVLLGKQQLANQKFDKIATEYHQLEAKVKNLKQPSVFTGMGYEGNWYVPGGESYVAQNIKDAGGNYLWKDQKGHSSIMLDFEAVFDKAKETDVWINVGIVNNKEDISKIDERYAKFNAYQSGRIFNGNARVSQGGGYDIYESAVVHPHIVLKDMIKIFHPNTIPDHKLYYYQQLK